MIAWWWLPIGMSASGILCFFVAGAMSAGKRADQEDLAGTGRDGQAESAGG